MSEATKIAIIAAIPPTLAVALAWLASRKKLTQIHIDLNSRLSQLIETTKKGAHAEGMEAQRKLDKPQ